MSFFAIYPAIGGGGGGGAVTSVNGQTGVVTLTTTDIPEGSNLYYTNERVDDQVAALIQNGTGLTWTYNDGANTLTGNVSLTPFSTTNLAEGTNLYFTDERAQDAVGGGFQAPLVYNDGAGTFSITQSGAATDGYLSSVDWNTFNNKQDTLTLGDLTGDAPAGISITGGVGAVVGAGTSISQQVANTTDNGYLSSTDWNTFNNKQPAGNYITDLTGDVTATGPGSVAATIANLAVTNAKIANATIDLTTKVTGVLPIANGGTNGATALAGFNNLSPLTTNGDLLYHNGTNNVRLGIGSTNEVLTVVGGIPAWSAVPQAEVIANVRATEGAGTTTLVAADNHIQIFDLSAARNVDLPSTGVAQGEIWTIENTTAFDLTVRAADSNPILYTTAFAGSDGDAVIQIGQVVLEAMVAAPATPADWRVVSVQETYEEISGISLGGALAGATGVLQLTRKGLTINGWMSSDTVTATAVAAATIPTSTIPTRFCYTGGGNNLAPTTIYVGGQDECGFISVASNGSASVYRYNQSAWGSTSGLSVGGGYESAFNYITRP